MQIILWIIFTIVFLVISYLLGIQFYKLGIRLKEKHPITYRLYVISWILIGAIVAVALMVGAQDSLRNYEYNKKQEELSSILELDKPKVWEGKQTSNRGQLKELKEAIKNTYADNDAAYNMILTSKVYSSNIAKAKSKGFTDKEISSAMGLSLSYDYQPPKMGTMDDLHQMMKRNKD